MNPFKSLTRMASSVSGLLKSAQGLLVKAGSEGFGGGFKGVVQDLLDLNLEGVRESVDTRMGVGVMHLTLAGETDRVETAGRFRNYTIMRLEEMMEMRDIANLFISQDISEVARAVDGMAGFLEKRQPETACSDREEVLEQEINRLRKIVREMSRFLDGEQELLDAGAVAAPPPQTVPGGVVESKSTPTQGIIIGFEKRDAEAISTREGKKGKTPVMVFMDKYAWWFRIGGLAIAVVVLALLPTVSGLAVIIAVIVLLIYLAVIELLR